MNRFGITRLNILILQLQKPTTCTNRKNMEPRKIKLYIDLPFCLVFLPLIIALVPVERWIVKYPFFAITLILFLYCVYFFIRGINIPQMVMKQRYLKLALAITVLAVTAYAVSKFPFPKDYVPMYDSIPNLHKIRRAQTVWLLFLVVSGFSLSTSLLIELIRQLIVKKEIEAQKNKAELSMYKAQINPHFLFNTLNTLYGLTICKADNAEDAFVKFIDIMRYTYSQVKLEKVSMGDEIRYINDYISLQSLRLNDHTTVKWHHSIDDNDVTIPPMLLITFVENAFKYGTSSSKNSIIDIRASLVHRKFKFEVSNSIMRTNDDNERPVGLENCKARLELLYPDCHTLSINKDNDVFSVTLNIDL